MHVAIINELINKMKFTPSLKIDIIGSMMIVCGGDRENYQVCYVRYSVEEFCTAQCTHI